MTVYVNIDVPFENRHTCWFCGEPSDHEVKFPEKYSDIHDVNHVPLIFPSCYECKKMKFSQSFSSISGYRDAVKDQLVSKYQKELSVGANWTEKELQESDFSGSALEGLKRSGWLVYQIAKGRVNYKGWPLSIDSIQLDAFDTGASFEFDGTRYTSVDAATEHLGRVLNIDVNLLNDLVYVLGKERFSYALKICRLNPVVSVKERKNIVDDIYDNEQELQLLESENVIRSQDTGKVRNVKLASISTVRIANNDVASVAIQWAMERNISSLVILDEREDDFFDHFESEGGVTAFTYYNGLQLYLEKLEDKRWADLSDPNRDIW